MLLRNLLIASVAAGIAGCAVRPLPEDVTNYDTYSIVKKVRCEMRDAVRRYAIGAIKRYDPGTAEVSRLTVENFRNINRARLNYDARKILEKYDQGAIVYDFTFDITENNDASASIDVLRPLTNGVFNLGASGFSNRARGNRRIFKVTDNFEELTRVVKEEYCHFTPNQLADNSNVNYNYPISGNLNLIEMAGAFFNLNEDAKLRDKTESKVPTLSDTIEFTTHINGTLTGAADVGPFAGRSLQLNRVGFGATNGRKDIHSLVIAISLPADPGDAEFAGRGASDGQRRMSAVRAARDAVEEQKRSAAEAGLKSLRELTR